MKSIAICSPEISYGDAVSNDVFGMYNVLKGQNYNAGIFVENILTSEDNVKNIECVSDFIKKSDDLLIYHVSTEWPKGMDILSNLDCVKIIKYHNITPPDFFYNFSSDHVANCGGGLKQLRTIANLDLDMCLNDSLFNMKEMISIGVDALKCYVVPPFNNIERIKELKPDFDVLKKYNDGRVNILSVGRIAPNKGFEKLIEAFAFYNEHYNPESRLIIVGNKQTPLSAYVNYLDNKVSQLNLQDRVLFTGKVNDEELKSYYLVSKIFALTSYHEGFCVPLVEAMSMKIPVVVYNSTAVSDTVGGAGIVWDDLDSSLFASTFNEIIINEEAYYFLGEAGWRRYLNNFTNEIIGGNFLELVSDFL
jgi:glycosyltransferase involved in cell wall biosynthesis